jgi:hypothetical protein
MFPDDSMRLLPRLVSLAVLAQGSCGRGDGTASVAGYTKIDDMEGEGGHIAWSPDGLSGTALSGMVSSGFWTSTTDCEQADKILPAPYFLSPDGWTYDSVRPPYQTMPGILPSTHAAHLRTNDHETLQGVWGANMGFDFTSMPSAVTVDGGASADEKKCRQGSARDFGAVPVDLSMYSGFTFWAMASTSGRQSIRVQINNVATDPRGEVCTPLSSSDEEYCYNGFGKAILLTDQFTQYWVDFSELRQDPTWSHDPSLKPFDPASGAFSMNFEVPLPGCTTDKHAKCAGGNEPVSFDVWIDDLYFVNKPAQ